MTDTAIYSDAFAYSNGALSGKGSPAWVAGADVSSGTLLLSSSTAVANYAVRPAITQVDSYIEIDTKYSRIDALDNTWLYLRATGGAAFQSSPYIRFDFRPTGEVGILQYYNSAYTQTAWADAGTITWAANTYKRIRGDLAGSNARLIVDGVTLLSASGVAHTTGGTAALSQYLNGGGAATVTSDNFAWGSFVAGLVVTAVVSDGTASATAPSGILQLVTSGLASSASDAPASHSIYARVTGALASSTSDAPASVSIWARVAAVVASATSDALTATAGTLTTASAAVADAIFDAPANISLAWSVFATVAESTADALTATFAASVLAAVAEAASDALEGISVAQGVLAKVADSIGDALSDLRPWPPSWSKRPVDPAAWSERATGDATWATRAQTPTTWTTRTAAAVEWLGKAVDPSTWTKR